jgi:2-keto-4-pentenoate hydratase/2-oxohepta-3-ene-1,7-dioic acid hydratase in catechol pathway
MTSESANLVAWERLVRYISSSDGAVKYGQPILDNANANIAELAEQGELKVHVLEGRNPLEAKPTQQEDGVKALLGPLRVEDVPIIRCIGLNYKTHIKETGRAFPKCPTVFTKPAPAIADYDEAIPIPKFAQEQCDYEGELTILIGRDAYDVKAENALDYVAAYTVGNDVSARDWQREPGKAGVVPQWSFSKSFDKYAPLGPALVSASVLGAADRQDLKTIVNGDVRQSGNTGDLCFGVRDLIAFCSQGQTLQKGSLIMTGTPGGVGLFMSPPTFLKDGDVVEVEVGGIGRLRNTMKFM